MQGLGEETTATFLTRSRASGVRYGGSTSFPLMILSMVFFRFSAVKGGWRGVEGKRSLVGLPPALPLP